MAVKMLKQLTFVFFCNLLLLKFFQSAIEACVALAWSKQQVASRAQLSLTLLHFTAHGSQLDYYSLLQIWIDFGNQLIQIGVYPVYM
jgi:hypothetical protein